MPVPPQPPAKTEVPRFVTQTHNGFIASVRPVEPHHRTIDRWVMRAWFAAAFIWAAGFAMVVAGLANDSASLTGWGAGSQAAGWFGGLGALFLTGLFGKPSPMVVRLDRGWVEVAGRQLMLVGLRIRREEGSLFLDDHEVICSGPEWLEQALRQASRDAVSRRRL